jgi:hypothetical protein
MNGIAKRLLDAVNQTATSLEVVQVSTQETSLELWV